MNYNKVILFFVALILLLPFASAQKNVGNAVISFDKLFFDYGDIIQSSDGTALFEFTNNGTENLVIDTVEMFCSCVELDYTKTIVKPNQKGFIKIKYNTNIVGEIKRSITVVCNNATNKRTVLLLTGNVILKDK